jgi:hypothetical protein
MGHDISGFNKVGEEIAYARFSMENVNATILYRLLQAYEYYAGVSGSGGSTSFTTQQCQEALKRFTQLYTKGDSLPKNHIFIQYDQKQIQDFLTDCLATAQKEGSVKVYFG